MKKSCERIAQVLGIKDTHNLPERSILNEPKYSQMENPSKVRAQNSTKEEDGQPSGYKSLREKSPARRSPSRGSPKRGEDTSMTKFATVSDALKV